MFTRLVAPSWQANSARGTVQEAFRPDVRDSRAVGHHPNWVIHQGFTRSALGIGQLITILS
jgi:hypothetical protein